MIIIDPNGIDTIYGIANYLPPMALDKFKARTIANKETENRKKQRRSCDICQKKFTNDKQYNNHFISKKHKERMKNINTENQMNEIVNTKIRMYQMQRTHIQIGTAILMTAQ
jgi:hypothetical protein